MARRKKTRVRPGELASEPAPTRLPDGGQVSRAPAPDSAEFGARLREYLAAELDKPCPESATGATNFEALSEKVVQMAVGGSKDAMHILLDHLAGRVPQAASSSDVEPQHIEYVIEIPRPNHEPQGDSTAGGLPLVPPAE